MRDDIAVTNFGQASDTYDKGFFWRTYRDIEMLLARLLSKGPIRVSEVTADTITISGTATVTTLTLVPGDTPADPSEGQMWATLAGDLFIHINGVTKQVTLT